MSQRQRSRPLRQENGGFGSGQTATESPFRSDYIHASKRPVYYSRSFVSPFCNHSGLRFALSLTLQAAGVAIVGAAVVYLALHVAAALIGWRGVAITFAVGLWLAFCAGTMIVAARGPR